MTGFTPPSSQIPPGPAFKAAAVTASDTTVLSPTRYIYVGTTGDLAVLMAGDSSPVTLKTVPVGIYALCVQKVMATNTTASNLVALW